MSNWAWKLRLFLSADLVGSTAYKASQRTSRAPDWSPTFRAFFRDFPRFVESCYAELATYCPSPAVKLRPWKFSGDEILFCVELADHREVVTHLSAFKVAVRDYPKEWISKGIPLRLKATAWLAGFPITNTELEYRGAEGPPQIDFIGPSIDLGFRLTRFAAERRFILAADLALMLLDAIDSPVEAPREHFQLHLDRMETLKGVIDGHPYPVIWLDTRDGVHDVEDLAENLMGRRRESNHSGLKDFLRKFIDAEQLLCRPFIEHDPDQRYGQIPAEFDDLRSKMQAEESERGYLEDGEAERPPEGAERTPPEPRPPAAQSQ